MLHYFAIYHKTYTNKNDHFEDINVKSETQKRKSKLNTLFVT